MYPYFTFLLVKSDTLLNNGINVFFQTCVKFTNTSKSFDLTDLEDTKTIYFTFTFGSMGPVLQYKKGEVGTAYVHMSLLTVFY